MQATLERAIEAATQEHVTISASGRTDAGAHAFEQVISFPCTSSLRSQVLQRAINAHLPRDIVVTSLADTSSDFHPRHTAVSRVYRYLIWNRPERSPFWEGRAAHVRPPVDTNLMQLAANYLLGNHDFSTFVPARLDGGRGRLMHHAECKRNGHLVIIELEAKGFMRQMVRSIAGTLVQIGQGKRDPSEMAEIILSKRRDQAGMTMPACGLYLLEVKYEGAGTRDCVPTNEELT